MLYNKLADPMHFDAHKMYQLYMTQTLLIISCNKYLVFIIDDFSVRNKTIQILVITSPAKISCLYIGIHLLGKQINTGGAYRTDG